MDLLDVALEIHQSYRDSKYAADVIYLKVSVFAFTCNPVTGAITYLPEQDKEGNVTVRLSDAVANSYIQFITEALKLAAKMDLISRCEGLNDKEVNDIIRKGSPLNEHSIPHVLVQLTSKGAIIGLFAHSQSDQHQKIRNALTKVGNIVTYEQTETAWAMITETETPKPRQAG